MSLLTRIFKLRSIGQRFALTIGTGAAAILIVLATAIYINGRELLLDQTSRLALREAHDEIGNWDDLVERIGMLSMAIAAKQTTLGDEQKVTLPWLAALLEQCPIKSVYGLYLILDKQDWKTEHSFLFVDRKSWPHAQQLHYDFHEPTHDWYYGAKEKKGIHVTHPYFATGGSEIEMISISQPVYDAKRNFLGVAGADISLEEMRKAVREMHLRDFGTDLFGMEELLEATKLRKSSYLISHKGAVILGPQGDKKQAVPKPGEKNPDLILGGLRENGLVINPEHLSTILSNESGWLRLTEGTDRLVCWAQSQTTGWKILLVIPYTLIVNPARQLAITSIIIGSIGLILLLGVILVVGRRVAMPIRELQDIASNFENGVYDEHLGILHRIAKRADELGRFALSFLAMAREIRMREDRLTQWNVNLEATINERTTELERAMKIVEKTNSAMASELAEAAAYARAVLPPKIKGRVTTDWDFEASSELGGDSFGYHWVDDDHFAIYLLDVCGHGVGAALLSISVVNLLRTSSLTETDFLDPSAVLASLNETFPMEQHNDMYFTAWYGVYQASTREIRFACAGHPPAVLISREGKASQLSASGVIVGAFPAAKFETRCIVVPEGSQLYLFSDGVYEIDRPNKPMMTYDEFVEILSNTTEKASIEKIVSEVKHQQGTNSFADDFSLIQLCFLEPKLTSDECVILNNSMEEWSKLLRFTEKFGIDHGISNDDIVSVDVIIEEIVTNIIKYGGVPPDTETCRVELNLRGTFLEIKISDNGNPFNPLLLPEVDTDQGIESRPIGGLGIHFVKKLTTSQYYEYCNKQNVLTLIKEL